ncbi:polysaccharide pyruvyl transferase family protein [Alteromonas sp.]|uniref:polysaccharide pyruvyl transferase family protein n=1 Tax=Alteromonas sp. TaxID=232 RepID=UPI000B669D2F|nr:polysaccharide pyruvyl transferase family protein [Alteromonas sp.]MAI37317.1 hypothetical protein [Alteromonas sp.]OUX88901.1 MAG: hypothetical protein CBB95_06655 [Alteromonas sp. TMED35]
MKVIFRILRMLRFLLINKKLVGMISPAPPGSLGDEALISGFSALIKSKGKRFQEILVYPNTIPCENEIATDSVLNFINDGRKSNLTLAIKLLKYEHLYIIGADTLDGGYSPAKNLAWVNIANLASELGVAVSFISFSFSNEPNSSVLDALSKSNSNIKFCARDPASKNRFEQLTSKPAKQVADLAFSMVPVYDKEHVKKFRDWLESEKKAGKIIIGLNINTLPLDIPIHQIVSNFYGAIKKTLNNYENVTFALLPHDFRENQSDEAVLAQLASKLNEPDRIRLFRGPFHASEVKAVVSGIDMLISGRMHLAIAALSQGVPVFCFTYKDKFEGLMAIFGLDNTLFDKSLISSEETILSTLESAISNYAIQSAIIKEKLPSVKKLSALNVDTKD